MEERFLDLDKIVPESIASLVFNGKKHVMKEMSVADFIWAQSAAAKENLPVEEQTELFLEVLMRSWPTIEKKELEELSPAKLRALLEFTNGVGEKGVEQYTAEAAAEGKLKVEVEPS